MLLCTIGCGGHTGFGCSSCTNSGCAWCHSTSACVDDNTYVCKSASDHVGKNGQSTCGAGAAQALSWTSLGFGIAGSSSGTWNLSSSFSSNYNSEIAISGTVMIQGNGAVLDASTKGRFFNVGSGGSLTLQSLTLQNGKATVGHFILNASLCWLSLSFIDYAC